MSILSEIQRIDQAKDDIVTALENKGVIVPQGTKIDDVPILIDTMASGGTDDSLINLVTRSGETIIIPDGVETIGHYAFAYCEDLLNVQIPNSVTSMGNYAFRNCSSLTLDSMPSSIRVLGVQTFIGCSSLDLSEIPETIESMGSSVFRDCTSLTKIKIKNKEWSVTCFHSCSNLRTVWISSSCISIVAATAANSPFTSCPTNLVIYTDAPTKQAGWGNFYNRCGNNGTSSATVHFNVSEAQFDALFGN